MNKTLLVCGRCGRSMEFHAAIAAGWLNAQRVGKPAGYLVIRCPDHITGHALRLAGLPQQTTSRRITDNLDRGLWACYAPGYVADVWRDRLDEQDLGQFVLDCHEIDMPAFRSERFSTVEALIVAMRGYKSDLRRWKLVELD